MSSDEACKDIKSDRSAGERKREWENEDLDKGDGLEGNEVEVDNEGEDYGDTSKTHLLLPPKRGVRSTAGEGSLSQRRIKYRRCSLSHQGEVVINQVGSEMSLAIARSKRRLI